MAEWDDSNNDEDIESNSYYAEPEGVEIASSTLFSDTSFYATPEGFDELPQQSDHQQLTAPISRNSMYATPEGHSEAPPSLLAYTDADILDHQRKGHTSSLTLRNEVYATPEGVENGSVSVDATSFLSSNIQPGQSSSTSSISPKPSRPNRPPPPSVNSAATTHSTASTNSTSPVLPNPQSETNGLSSEYYATPEGSELRPRPSIRPRPPRPPNPKQDESQVIYKTPEGIEPAPDISENVNSQPTSIYYATPEGHADLPVQQASTDLQPKMPRLPRNPLSRGASLDDSSVSKNQPVLRSSRSTTMSTPPIAPRRPSGDDQVKKSENGDTSAESGSRQSSRRSSIKSTEEHKYSQPEGFSEVDRVVDHEYDYIPDVLEEMSKSSMHNVTVQPIQEAAEPPPIPRRRSSTVSNVSAQRTPLSPPTIERSVTSQTSSYPLPKRPDPPPVLLSSKNLASKASLAKRKDQELIRNRSDTALLQRKGTLLPESRSPPEPFTSSLTDMAESRTKPPARPARPARPPATNNTEALWQYAWFHGNVTRENAERLLFQLPHTGRFLVRESATKAGDYSLSVLVSSTNIAHIRLQSCGNNELCLGESITPENTFKDIPTMVRYYANHQLPLATGQALLLSSVCARPVFSDS